jgi:putative spermidine/putrescine transport system ATP-binding protein
VYNAPATEFIARFMGGHNVIDTQDGKVAVRNDHMVIAPASDTIDALFGIPGTVTDVEYQGTYVLLGLQARDAVGEKELSVMLPEAQFTARRYATGESVHLTWAQDNAHALPA